MDRDRKIIGAMTIAEALLWKHGLEDWRVCWSGMRLSVAEANHEERLITISKYLIMKASIEDFKGVVLHEIAHALLGPGYGHGEEFKELCEDIGGISSATAAFNLGRYMFTCPECGNAGAHNSSKKKFCASCYKDGKKVAFNMEVLKSEVKDW